MSLLGARLLRACTTDRDGAEGKIRMESIASALETLQSDYTIVMHGERAFGHFNKVFVVILVEDEDKFIHPIIFTSVKQQQLETERKAKLQKEALKLAQKYGHVVNQKPNSAGLNSTPPSISKVRTVTDPTCWLETVLTNSSFPTAGPSSTAYVRTLSREFTSVQRMGRPKRVIALFNKHSGSDRRVKQVLQLALQHQLFLRLVQESNPPLESDKVLAALNELRDLDSTLMIDPTDEDATCSCFQLSKGRLLFESPQGERSDSQLENITARLAEFSVTIDIAIVHGIVESRTADGTSF